MNRNLAKARIAAHHRARELAMQLDSFMELTARVALKDRVPQAGGFEFAPTFWLKSWYYRILSDGRVQVSGTYGRSWTTLASSTTVRKTRSGGELMHELVRVYDHCFKAVLERVEMDQSEGPKAAARQQEWVDAFSSMFETKLRVPLPAADAG